MLQGGLEAERAERERLVKEEHDRIHQSKTHSFPFQPVFHRPEVWVLQV